MEVLKRGQKEVSKKGQIARRDFQSYEELPTVQVR